MTWIAWVVLASLAFAGFSAADAQPAADAYATKYFLEAPPAAAHAWNLPPNARDVVVAKVRVNSIAYLIGRDQSGAPPRLPKDLFAASVEVTDIVSGKATPGTSYDLYFGVPGGGRRHTYPHTPRMRTSEYFIVSYLEDDARRRLVGFAVGEEEYEDWYREVLAYERERGRPGARP